MDTITIATGTIIDTGTIKATVVQPLPLLTSQLPAGYIVTCHFCYLDVQGATREDTIQEALRTLVVGMHNLEQQVSQGGQSEWMLAAQQNTLKRMSEYLRIEQEEIG